MTNPAAAYRKRPVVVEAIQWTGYNPDDIRTFAGTKFDTVDIEDRGDDPDVTGAIFDDLHSTWVGVKDGQWIIRGTKGEFYPCDAEVFAEVYEPADPEAMREAASRLLTAANEAEAGR